MSKKTDVSYIKFPDIIDKAVVDIDDRYMKVISVVTDTATVSGTPVTVKFLQIQMIDKTINLPVCTQKLTIEDMEDFMRLFSTLHAQLKTQK